VQSREQDTLLGWTATHIHPTGERKWFKKQSQKHDNLNSSLASRLDWIANWIGDLHGIEEIGSSLTALERLFKASTIIKTHKMVSKENRNSKRKM
jgi:hypothetical protein